MTLNCQLLFLRSNIRGFYFLHKNPSTISNGRQFLNKDCKVNRIEINNKIIDAKNFNIHSTDEIASADKDDACTFEN